jgi:hypothetical protein
MPVILIIIAVVLIVAVIFAVALNRCEQEPPGDQKTSSLSQAYAFTGP